MPLYEYICEQKHITVELRPAAQREKDATCGTCKKPAIVKISRYNTPKSR